MIRGTQRESPCLYCTRVRDPKNCENKLCNEWRIWWIGRWEAMRTIARQHARGKGIQGSPVSVGGTMYHHPDRVREYLMIDPCLQCPWKDGLCPNPCDTKQIWLSEKEVTGELET